MTTSSNHARKPTLLLALIGAVVALAVIPSAAFSAPAVPALTLKLGSTEDYQFKAGDTVVIDTSSIGSNDRYSLTVTEPNGTPHVLATCAPGPTGQNHSGTYTLTGALPTTNTDWTVSEDVWLSSTVCTGTPTSLSKTFNVAKATSYNDLDAQTSTFGPGSTAHVGVEGLDQSATWSVKWVRSTTQCQNTAGADRPTSDASGVLPTTGKLQYQPGLTGDAWNLQASYDGACPAFAAANSGAWTLRLEADSAHFVDLPAFTVDGVAPTPTVTSPANNSFISSQSPALSGAIGTASGDNNAVSVDLFSGPNTSGTLVESPAASVVGSSWSTDPITSALADGQYTARVSQGDTVGNTGTGTSTFTVDTIDPDVAFTLTPSSPDGDNGWYTSKPTIHVVATDTNINTLSCTLNGSAVSLANTGSTSTTKSGDVPLPNGTGNADGTNDIVCNAQDKASNPGSNNTSFQLDTQDPTTQVNLTPGSPNGLNNYYTSVVVDASLSDVQATSSMTCTDALDGGAATPVTLTNTSGTPPATLTGTVPVSGDGSHQVSCTGTDDAGRTDTASRTFLLDEHSPSVSLAHPADGLFTSASAPSFDGSAGTADGDQAPVTVNIWSGTDTGAPAIQTLTPDGSSGSWSAIASSSLTDGTYTAQSQQSDLAGNVGTSSTHTFVVDSTKPTASIALNPASPNGANGTYTSPPNVHVSGDDANINGFSCTVNGTATAVTNVTGSGSHLEADVPVSGDGQRAVSCNAVDRAGNSSDPVGASFTVATPAGAASNGAAGGTNGTAGGLGVTGSGGNTVISSLLTLAGSGKQNPLKQHNVVQIKIKCTQACDLLAGGTLSVPNAAKVYKFTQLKKHLSSAGTTTLKLKIPKKALKALKKAIAKKKSSIAKIKVTAKAGGKSSNAQRTIVLKR